MMLFMSHDGIEERGINPKAYPLRGSLAGTPRLLPQSDSLSFLCRADSATLESGRLVLPRVHTRRHGTPPRIAPFLVGSRRRVAIVDEMGLLGELA